MSIAHTTHSYTRDMVATVLFVALLAATGAVKSANQYFVLGAKRFPVTTLYWRNWLLSDNGVQLHVRFAESDDWSNVDRSNLLGLFDNITRTSLGERAAVLLHNADDAIERRRRRVTKRYIRFRTMPRKNNTSWQPPQHSKLCAKLSEHHEDEIYIDAAGYDSQNTTTHAALARIVSYLWGLDTSITGLDLEPSALQAFLQTNRRMPRRSQLSHLYAQLRKIDSILLPTIE